MLSKYKKCELCPRRCRVDRTLGERGFCGADDRAEVNRIALHFMEEPVISGKNGSGTVFFTHCSLGCVYCQNSKISRPLSRGRVMSEVELAAAFFELESNGAHNINLVSPTHYLPTVISAVKIAKEKGLKIPIVYNTGGFERAENIKLLRGTVDIFLTDLKYKSPYLSGRYSASEDYFDEALPAIKEMVNITGKPRYSPDGMMLKGTVIRHLMLPEALSDTLSVLRTVALNFGDGVEFSLMRQYTPLGDDLPCELCRTVTDDEYQTAAEEFENLGLSGFLQQKESVGEDKVPKWDVC